MIDKFKVGGCDRYCHSLIFLFKFKSKGRNIDGTKMFKNNI